MISSKNIFYHELIGLELKVVDSSNPSLTGLCGTVVDETKKTLTIEVKEKVQSVNFSSTENGDSDSLETKDLGSLQSKDSDSLETKDLGSLQSKDSDSLETKDLGSNLKNHFNFIYREKLIQKDVSVFQFKVPDGTIVEIDGKILLNRPEDRIKRRYKKI